MATLNTTDKALINAEKGAKAPLLPLFFSARDLAVILNKGVSTVWRDAKNGDLPAPIKVGNSTRWRRADIQDWLAQFDVELEG